MSTPTPPEKITRLLDLAASGEREAAEQILPLVYDELRKLAASRLARERAEQTLEPTGLVHEAYMRLVGAQDPGWDGQGHFFAAAAEAMRRILIDRARDRQRQKRGGGDRQRVRVDLEALWAEPPGDDLLALDEALSALERHDPDAAALVRLRAFAGLTLAQAARALGIAQRTADRDWAYARAWLADTLGGGDIAEA